MERTEATDDPKRNGRPAKRAHGEKTIVFPEASDVFPGATGNPGDPRIRPSSITLLPDVACVAEGRATVGRCDL